MKLSFFEIIKSLPVRQAGVVQTFYDIVKAHGRVLKAETKGAEGSQFVIELHNV